MRHAPAVRVDCAGDPWWRWSTAVLYAAGAAAIAYALARRAGLAPLVAGGWAAGAAWVAAAIASRLERGRSHVLAWDGTAWRFDGFEAQPEVTLDFGAWLLLRVRFEASRTAWLPVAARRSGGAFHALRVALQASSGRGATFADGTSGRARR
jgi:hypothetical protein